MVCWYKCCPLIFRKNTPKRLLFKWDIVAMLILTIHDIVAFGIVIAASCLHDEAKQHPPYDKFAMPFIVWFMLFCNVIIIYLMTEHGFRLLEEGPWYGKVSIAVLHLIPSITYIAFVRIKFIHYMGFFDVGSLLPHPPPRYDPHAHQITVADIFGEVYGISVFHHVYVVLFESVLTLCTMLCCSPKEDMVFARPPPVEDLLPMEQTTVDGITVKLQLDSDSRIVFAGTEIKGRIVFEGTMLEGSNRSATINITGQSVVTWKQSSCCRGAIPLQGYEPLYDYTVDTVDMFQTILPPNLPPTFFCGMGPTASISYCITATVDLKNGHSPFLVKLPFILRPSKMTTSPFQEDHSVFTESLSMCGLLGCIPFNNGPYGFSLELPKTSYLIGEEIPFSAEIFNRSRRPVLKIYASLVSVVDLVDSTHGFRFTDELLMTWDELAYGSLMAGEVAIWNGKLKVPITMPESGALPLSSNIPFTNYYFRFLVEIKGLSENAELEVPISIGLPIEGHTWIKHHSIVGENLEMPDGAVIHIQDA